MEEVGSFRRQLFGWGVKIFLPDVVRALETMVRWESLGAEDVRRLQLEKLNRLLEFHCRRPFYRTLCESVGAPPLPLKRIADLALYPVVTKEFLRQCQQEIAGSPQAYRQLSTSGSSGINLIFYQSREAARARTASMHRCNIWIGYDNWGDPAVTVWGRSPYQTIKKRATDRVKRMALNIQLLSSFGMDDALALAYAHRIRKVKPKAVDGYPSYLSQIARVGLSMGVPPYTNAVVTHSGEQALPSDLESIRAFFGEQVYARYGSREFGVIAHEVPGEFGYRVPPTRFVLENDSQGGILVTDLDNRASPFVRYSIGDAGTVVDEDEKKAVTPQRVVELQGRVHDRLETSDGRLVPGQFWTLLTRIVPGIEAFQVVQTASDCIELRVQVDPIHFGDQQRNRLVREASKLLGPGMTVSIVQVSEVDRTRAGKRRFIIKDF